METEKHKRKQGNKEKEENGTMVISSPPLRFCKTSLTLLEENTLPPLSAWQGNILAHLVVT